MLIALLSSEYHWVNNPTAYGHAVNLARKMRDEYDAVLAKFDAIVMPTVTQPARRHVPVDSGPLAWFEASRAFYFSAKARANLYSGDFF